MLAAGCVFILRADGEVVTPEDTVRDMLDRTLQSMHPTEFDRLAAKVIDPANSWEELAAEFERVEQTYSPDASPDGAPDGGAFSREASQVLRRMVAEQTAHRDGPVDELPADRQAAEWIYRLRDLHLVKWDWDYRTGYPQAFGDEAQALAQTPVHHLVDMGDSAVPALIAALGDKSFTRTAVPARKLWDTYAPKPMRVGDIALKILEHDAGRQFSVIEFGASDDEQTRSDVDAWWIDRQRKGIKQQLIDDMAKRDYNSLSAAKKLAQLFPDSALGPINRAIGVTDEDSTRASLINIAAKLPGDSVATLLHAQLDSGSGPEGRIAAARGLLLRGDRSVIPSIIKAWHELDVSARRGPALPNEFHELLGFLAESRDPRAIDALAQLDADAAIDARFDVAWEFLPDSGVVTHFPILPGLVSGPDAPPAEAVDAAIERLLLGFLRDKAKGRIILTSYQEKDVSKPRVCDVAAMALAARWPQRYQFDPSARLAARDAAIAAMARGR
jgi:hypothetical protein